MCYRNILTRETTNLSTLADGTMNTLHEFIHGLETFLNNEPIMKKRNDHIKSTIGDNRALIEIQIQGQDTFTVELKEKRFCARTGIAQTPLLRWSVPLALFKDVLLGKEKMLSARSTRTLCTPPSCSNA